MNKVVLQSLSPLWAVTLRSAIATIALFALTAGRGLGVAGTGVAYWAAATASRLLPAVTTLLGLLATPMVSVITATLWLGEPLTVSLGAAIALVLGGVAIGATDRGRGDRASGLTGSAPSRILPP